jgi:hypothetical protein
MKTRYTTYGNFMQFWCDDKLIDGAGLEDLLVAYAKAVMRKMQEADKDDGNDDCWTACVITMDDLTPIFRYGDIEEKELLIELAMGKHNGKPKPEEEGYVLVELELLEDSFAKDDEALRADDGSSVQKISLQRIKHQ